MELRMSALERAFELAKSGQVEGVKQLIARLKREGYDQRQVDGRYLRRQLADLMRESRGGSDGHGQAMKSRKGLRTA
jgi:hypothetical protein